MESLEKNLPVLIVNGATLLIVVVILIRVLARVIDRVSGEFAMSLRTGMDALKNEVVLLRQDIRTAGHENAVAVGMLTERVSRIEGKIEGIVMARAPELTDSDDELTPVGVPVPTDNVYIDPDLVPTPPAKRAKTAPPTRTTPAGAYHVVKPKER
jgi:hypothetical protein